MVLLAGMLGVGDRSTTLAHRTVHKENASKAIHLALCVRKKTYHAGEAIRILAYLENTTSDETYYVGRSLGNFFVIEPFHYIELSIVDGKGQPVSSGLVGNTSIWKSGTPISEKLKQEYLLLGPRMIFGQRDEGNIRLQPGRYTLTAVYYELEAEKWTRDDRSAIPFPVWTKRLVSNRVAIRVLR